MGLMAVDGDKENGDLRTVVEFAGQSVCICHPASLDHLAALLFGEHRQNTAAGLTAEIRVVQAGNGKFELIDADGAVSRGIEAARLPKQLKKAAMRALTARLSEKVILRGGLVCRNGASILLAGRPGFGGPFLSAWMAGHGYTVHTGDMVSLADSAGEPTAFSSPLVFHTGEVASVNAGVNLHQSPE